MAQKWGEGAPLNQTKTQLGEGPDQGELRNAMKGAETSAMTAQNPSLLEAMRGPAPNLFLTFWKPLGTISPGV